MSFFYEKMICSLYAVCTQFVCRVLSLPWGQERGILDLSMTYACSFKHTCERNEMSS